MAGSAAAVVLYHLAERRIDDAVARGLLDDLPGKGRPLRIDLLEDVPEELRAAYTVLRAAGCVPEAVERRRARLRLQDLLRCCDDAPTAAELRRELRHALLAEALAAERARSAR